jgi:hypothetical protein
VGRYRGFTKLVHYIDFGRTEEKASGSGGLVESNDELGAFKPAYRRKIRSSHFSVRNHGRFRQRPRWVDLNDSCALSEEGEILYKAC